MSIIAPGPDTSGIHQQALSRYLTTLLGRIVRVYLCFSCVHVCILLTICGLVKNIKRPKPSTHDIHPMMSVRKLLTTTVHPEINLSIQINPWGCFRNPPPPK